MYFTDVGSWNVQDLFGEQNKNAPVLRGQTRFCSLHCSEPNVRTVKRRSGLLTRGHRLERTANAGHDHAAEEEHDPCTKRHGVLKGPQHTDQGKR